MEPRSLKTAAAGDSRLSFQNAGMDLTLTAQCWLDLKLVDCMHQINPLHFFLRPKQFELAGPFAAGTLLIIIKILCNHLISYRSITLLLAAPKLDGVLDQFFNRIRV